MKTLKVKITFIEELLGSSAASPDIHAEYIASNVTVRFCAAMVM